MKLQTKKKQYKNGKINATDLQYRLKYKQNEIVKIIGWKLKNFISQNGNFSDVAKFLDFWEF